MATAGVSSSKLQKVSMGFTTALTSALLEWMLILFLIIDAIFSYIITKFAYYCKLQAPCLFCSRLDHVLGNEKEGYYWDFICSGHKLEISSLVLCRTHNKLVNVHGMCEGCLFSFATINKSNAETYRLLVGKLGEESDSMFDQDPLLGDNKVSNSSRKHCSCCDEQWLSKGYDYDKRLLLTKSLGSEAVELDIPLSVRPGNVFHEKRTAKISVSVRATQLRNSQLDPLSHVGYTELNVTSDNESEVSLSDDDGTGTPVHETDYTKEDIKVQCVQMEPRIIDLEENLASEKLGDSASPCEPSLLESGMRLDYSDNDGSKSAAATTESVHGLEELNWQQAQISAVFPSPSEPITFNDVTPSSDKMEVPVEVSKESYELTTDEAGLTSQQKSATECEEIIKSGKCNGLTTSEAGLEPGPVSSDIAHQYTNLLDLGDAYKLAISNRGRQLSGRLEQWLAKDSSRISEDLKILLSQLSATRGTDLSVNDMSPRLSMNSDEVKATDASNSAGMQILQKRISLERNESGLSIDGSIVSEIEGESMVDRLKRQVDHDRKLVSALYKELEEERSASSVAANQALAMINRLQEEKASLHMEALQYLRMMDEQSEYDMEALQKANDLLAEKEKEIEYLESELQFYRKKFPDESMLGNLMEANSVIKVKDIELDHSQSTCIANDESICERSITENPNISDTAEGLHMSLEEKTIGPVKKPQLEFEDERLYIFQRLKKLEKQVYLFMNIHQSPNKGINSENTERESPEDCVKVDNNLSMQDFVASQKLNLDARGDDSSSKRPPICKDIGELEYNGHCSPSLFRSTELASVGSLFPDLLGRLQVLEADQIFLEHSVNILSSGEDGLKLLQEIADHLQQLRRLGIR